MNCIEILSVSLLSSNHTLVEEMRNLAEGLSIGLGWHYLLDLSWVARRLIPRPGMRVLDAGAGTGIMQWWLADQAVDVVSVDRLSRRDLPALFRRRYPTRGWRREDLAPWKPQLRDFLPPRSPRRWRSYPNKLATSLRRVLGPREYAPGSGTIFIYNQDVATLQDIPNNSVDAVVSVSALEHNSPDGLRACVVELMRVLKPGGKIVATLGAAKQQDWFHAPSRGWCYTETTLRDLFELPADCSSNYDRYDELLDALRNCGELRDRLADFYFSSGDNGMPWGHWDPKYQPVGVVKTKRV